jgi:hypothetical protein
LRGGTKDGNKRRREGRKIFKKYMSVTLDITHRLQFFQDDVSETA